MIITDAVKLGEKVITVISDVKDLKKQVERLDDTVRDHGERIVSLERGEEVITLKCQNSAIIAVSAMNNQLVERLVKIENSIVSSSNLSNHELPPSK